MRRAALDTDEHAISRFIEVHEDHTAVLERVVRHLLEPAVEIAIRETGGEHADIAPENALGDAALTDVGEVDGRHALIHEEPTESRNRARQSLDIGRLDLVQYRAWIGGGTAIGACRGSSEEDTSCEADGCLANRHETHLQKEWNRDSGRRAPLRLVHDKSRVNAHYWRFNPLRRGRAHEESYLVPP